MEIQKNIMYKTHEYYLKLKQNEYFLSLGFPLLSNTVIPCFRVKYHMNLSFTYMRELTIYSKSVHSSIKELLNIAC